MAEDFSRRQLRRGRSAALEENAVVLPRLATFQALKNRDYRYLWIAQLGNSASLWVETVARSWLVWSITGSATALATVNLLRALPMLLFGVIAGVIADRMDKRMLLIVSQIIVIVNKLALALLITFFFRMGTEVTESQRTSLLWFVYITAFIMGAAMALQQPTRTALIPSLVAEEDLQNAVALNNMAMNVTRVVGPSLAGLLLAPIGTDGVYYLSAFIYVICLYCTVQLRLPADLPRARQDSMWGNLTEGIAYVWTNKTILTLMVLALIPMTFGMPYMTLLPVVTDNVLHLGPSGLGLLYAASGVGAMAGALTVATFGASLRRRGALLLGGVFGFGAALLLVAVAPVTGLVFLFIAVAGFMSTSYMAINNAALLQNSPAELQGRVMSLYMMDRGLVPLGSMIGGTIADVVSVQAAIAFMGGVCVLLAMGALAVPQARRLN